MPIPIRLPGDNALPVRRPRQPWAGPPPVRIATWSPSRTMSGLWSAGSVRWVGWPSGCTTCFPRSTSGRAGRPCAGGGCGRGLLFFLRSCPSRGNRHWRSNRPGSAIFLNWDTGALAALVDLLEDPGVEKVGADLKASALSLAREGVRLRGMTFDVTIASYVLDPGRRKHDLEALCQDFLDFSRTPYNDVVGTGPEENQLFGGRAGEGAGLCGSGRRCRTPAD